MALKVPASITYIMQKMAGVYDATVGLGMATLDVTGSIGHAQIPEVLRTMPGARWDNLLIKNNVTNPNYQVDISAANINLNGIATGAVSETLDITVSTDLDTGSEAISTWYYIWAFANISDPAAVLFDYRFSTSATAPTYPTGYTEGVYIGAVYNDISLDFRIFEQKNDYTAFTASGRNLIASTSTSLISEVPVIAISFNGDLPCNSSGAGNCILAIHPGVASSPFPGQSSSTYTAAASNSIHNFSFELLNKDQAVYTSSLTNLGASVHVRGYRI